MFGAECRENRCSFLKTYMNRAFGQGRQIGGGWVLFKVTVRDRTIYARTITDSHF
jgi:hypothetical protein